MENQTDKKQPQLDPANKIWPVSPLVDIETPSARWEPGKSGTYKKGAFIDYVKSKNPQLPPNGWVDITPYFGKEWPKSLSSWRTSLAKKGYYMKITMVEKGELKYRAILVCLNPAR